MPRANKETAESAAPERSLQDFLEAYRPQGGAATSAEAKASPMGDMGSFWENRDSGRGRSARDWRADWEVHHRPPVRKSRNWKVIWLSVGVILSMVLSVYAVYLVDQVVNSPTSEFEQHRGAWSPQIHWGGNR